MQRRKSSGSKLGAERAHFFAISSFFLVETGILISVCFAGCSFQRLAIRIVSMASGQFNGQQNRRETFKNNRPAGFIHCVNRKQITTATVVCCRSACRLPISCCFSPSSLSTFAQYCTVNIHYWVIFFLLIGVKTAKTAKLVVVVLSGVFFLTSFLTALLSLPSQSIIPFLV